ncbi:MAG: S8 family serine peptidase [Geodermatophilaceae bacterium]
MLTDEQQQRLRETLTGRASSLAASGPTAFLLELDAPSSGQVFTANLPRGPGAAAAAATAAVGVIAVLGDRVLAALPQSVPEFTELYRTHAAFAGVAIETDLSNFAALAAIAGVRAVYPISTKRIDNAGAASLTRAARVWSALGNAGAGVSVGIVDTGIDYVHTDFGGAGTPVAYAAQTDAVASPNVYPSAKVVGGYDFVGDAYNADPSSPTYSPLRREDANPMDCNGHGSHVAGSAAGFGVNSDGSAFTGPYDEDVALNTMRIGPGMAPEADLYALRVFGCDGATNVTALAIDWAMDPNRDGVTDDHLDVVNLSLGSDYGLADDGDTVVVNRAAELGVSMVLSAGNGGDTFDIGASPGNAARAITVAASDQTDVVASDSSRGGRQINGLKPDVAAPGVTLYSAASGTGNGGVNNSGTSMASATTAGVVALIRSAHPTWTTEEVKAALMNTANEDIFTDLGRAGDNYAPNRVGAGRIDALDALRTHVLAFVQDAPGVVSASFGVIGATNAVTTMTRTIRVVNKGRTAQTFAVEYVPISRQPGVSYSLNRNSVTIGPGGATTVLVTITVERSALRKSLDPTMSGTQEDTLVGVGELPRQFVADASGRVVLTASASGSTQPQLRIPVHANAKPSSSLTQALSTFTGTSADLTLSGRGVRNGTPGTPNAYASLSSVFEKLGTSPRMVKCSASVLVDCYKSELERSVDLKAIGVATDAPLITNPARRLTDGFLYFGVAAHGRFTSPTAVVGYSVFIDATGDGVPDYELFTQRLFDRANGIDVVVVLGADLGTGTLLETPDGSLAAEFLNGAPGAVDTNMFDNDAVMLPFPIAALPLITTSNARFTFGVQATSYRYGTIDTVGTTPFGESVAGGMSFNALRPGLSFSSSSEGEVAQLLVSGPGTPVDVTRNLTQLAADRAVGGPIGILVIQSHNSTAAGRAQTVAVPG